jgi:hypothetical protein
LIETVARFRKKYTLALLLFVAGTALAFVMDSTLTEYTVFAGVLIGIFGTQDVMDKKVTK